jgi:hypothetical protein
VSFNKKRAALAASVLFALIAWAATYGPFRCTNGCEPRDPSDGFTRAFISADVNRALSEAAARRGEVHQWRPGDTLVLCNGNWCTRLDYHPLTGLFVWAPLKYPAWPDDGRPEYNIGFEYTEPQQQLKISLVQACLEGTFSWDNWGAYTTVEYRDEGDELATVVMTTDATLSIGPFNEFCGF